ncbi:hypothetical protein C0Q70_19816 [Pomacea canaliculata]|uniref:BTB domain-containing protein n=2 Tax=Pomacea canaliculata TaxID=400727 RepID=A0A2T7NDT9_POMCA|nr:hypothetical protein C0Q70_19816 [Pomacea canaliculata]
MCLYFYHDDDACSHLRWLARTGQNWYETDDIIECNRQMLEQQFACDVHFVVGEERERQGAHRYMLVSRSPVFAAMFHGSWHEPSDKDIEVPDVEPAAFRNC